MPDDRTEARQSMVALDEAIEVCGKTLSAFASAISTPEMPVSQSKVSMWRKRESVPAEYVPAIYRETLRRGQPVECERFHPHIDWAILREQSSSAASQSDIDSVVCGPTARPGSDRPSNHREGR